MKIVLALGLALVALAVGQEADKPIVDTHYGKLQGDVATSRDGRMFYQFKGIPYAKAPERFQIPEIPDNWDGIKDATKFGNKCPQMLKLKKEFTGDEACLNLNIFTPKLPKEGEHTILLPVIVALHFGGHFHGSGDLLGPKYLMEKDLILVTLNSRLGLLGYLNTGDMYAQGNMGLKDQAKALAWVQQNIEKFGGDKGRVTLLGSSSGAADVMLHLLSPVSKGLFHNAIVQSGSPLSPTAFIRDPINQAKKIGQQVGCPTTTSQELVMCLKGMTPEDIYSKATKPNYTDFNLDETAAFGPSIETILDGQTENDVVLSDIPYKLLTDGKIVNKVPLIVGVNNHDGLNIATAKLINSTELMSKLNKNWEMYAPNIMFFDKTSKDPAVVAKKIRDFYFGTKEVNFENKEDLLNIYTDRFYAAPTRFAAKKYSKHAPVYLYFFNHQPEVSLVDKLGFGEDFKKGASHLDELSFLFNAGGELHDKIKEITKETSEKDYNLSKGMVNLWSSFIETGKPTKTWGEGKKWKKVETPDTPRWYNLNTETKMMDEPEDFAARIKFWHDLYSTELISELKTPPQEKF